MYIPRHGVKIFIQLYIYLIHEMNHELIMFTHLFEHLFEIVKFYCATNVLIVRENFDTI